MKRITVEIPTDGISQGRYPSQPSRYRLESVFGICRPLEGTSLQVIVTAGGAFYAGQLLAIFGTQKSTTPYGAPTAYTLAPGVQLAEEKLNDTTWETLSGPIPHELWIEEGWELTLSYTAFTLRPIAQEPFRLVISIP